MEGNSLGTVLSLEAKFPVVGNKRPSTLHTLEASMMKSTVPEVIFFCNFGGGTRRIGLRTVCKHS